MKNYSIILIILFATQSICYGGELGISINNIKKYEVQNCKSIVLKTPQTASQFSFELGTNLQKNKTLRKGRLFLHTSLVSFISGTTILGVGMLNRRISCDYCTANRKGYSLVYYSIPFLAYSIIGIPMGSFFIHKGKNERKTKDL